jgi:hypothetical protein
MNEECRMKNFNSAFCTLTSAFKTVYLPHPIYKREAIVTTPDISPAPRSKLLLAWMIVSQIGSVLAVLASVGFFVFGYLLDSTGAFNFNFVVPYLLPILLLIPIIWSWVAYARRNEKLAWILTSFPVIYICLEFVIVFGWMFI